MYRGVYLRLHKSCTKIFILAASTGWEAHRRPDRRLYFPRKRGFWAEKNRLGEGMTTNKDGGLKNPKTRLLKNSVAKGG